MCLTSTISGDKMKSSRRIKSRKIRNRWLSTSFPTARWSARWVEAKQFLQKFLKIKRTPFHRNIAVWIICNTVKKQSSSYLQVIYKFWIDIRQLIFENVDNSIPIDRNSHSYPSNERKGIYDLLYFSRNKSTARWRHATYRRKLSNCTQIFIFPPRIENRSWSEIDSN